MLWDRVRCEYDGDELRVPTLLPDGEDPGADDRVASRERARGMNTGDEVLDPTRACDDDVRDVGTRAVGSEVLRAGAAVGARALPSRAAWVTAARVRSATGERVDVTGAVAD